MPTYDYICSSCGNAWELEQRIVEDAVKDCPKCGRSTAKRQISAGAGFILKGGGWYADLYSSKPSGGDSKPDDKGGKTEKKSDEATSKPDAGKSDSKEGGGGSGSTPDKGNSPSGKGDVKAA